MNNINWRALAAIGAVMVIVMVAVNVAFSFIGGSALPVGYYGNPTYGSGMMMGPWTWGGMGFFWIFPIAGFAFIMLCFGTLSRMFVAGSPPSLAARRTEFCGNCGRAIELSWVACPHCGSAAPKSGNVAQQSPPGQQSAV